MLRYVVEAGAAVQRLFQPSLTRAEFIRSIPTEGLILEIGPGSAPVVRGQNVRYFDVKDQSQLIDRARVSSEDETGCPHIDYKSETADLGIIDERFDAIVSSHSIEHQPDLVRHLQSVAGLLNPGGRYFLAVPDKRFCFDHFAKLSEPRDAEMAFQERRGNHPPSTVKDHYRRHTHNSPLRHWVGVHGKPGVLGQPENLEAMLADAAAGRYVDAHAWAFTPKAFAEIVEATEKLHGLRVESISPTRFGSLEFFAVLR